MQHPLTEYSIENADLSSLEKALSFKNYNNPELIKEYLIARSIVTDSGCVEFHGFGKKRRVYQKGPNRAWTHRLSYALFNGPLMAGMDVTHSCENPPCINPKHLGQKTHKDNCRESVAIAGSKCPHPRERGEDGNFKPCKPCNAEAQQRWRDRQNR